MDSFNIILEAMHNSDSCIDDVKYLFQGGLEVDVLVQIRDQNKRSLLHHASEIGLFEFAKQLIDTKANVNAQDETLVTPIHLGH